MSPTSQAVEARPSSGGFGSRRTWVAAAVGGVLAGVGAVLGGWLVLAASAGGDEGARLDVEVPVTPMELRLRRAVTSPVVARDPTNAEFVVAATRRDAPQPSCGLQASGTSGEQWVTVDAVGSLPEGVERCSTPSAGFDAQGRLHFAFIGVDEVTRPAGLFVVTSDDRAQTFSQPHRVADPATFATSVAVDEGGVVEAAWLRPPEGSSDGEGGRDWPVGSAVVAAAGDAVELDEPVVVADPEGLVAAPVVATGAEGATVVAYYELPAAASAEDGLTGLVGAGPWRLMVARRDRPAGAFGEPVAVAEFALPEQPALLSDEPPWESPHPHLVSRWGIAEPGLAVGSDRVCAAWTDFADAEALRALASCAPAGAEWSEPVRLAAGLPEVSSAWLPQVAVGPAGAVEAVFYARRGGLRAGVWHTAVRRSGGEVAAPQRLSSQSSHPQAAPQPGWYGTQLGLAAGPANTVALWADSRNALPVYPNQSVFAATVAAPQGRGGLAGWVAGGLVAVGLATVVGAWWWRRRSATAEAEVAASAGAPP